MRSTSLLFFILLCNINRAYSQDYPLRTSIGLIYNDIPYIDDYAYEYRKNLHYFTDCESIDSTAKHICSIEKLRNYIYSNLSYTEEALQNKAQGKVWVKFIVEKDGGITNEKILKDIGFGCGNEVLRIIKLMPKWSTGSARGKALRQQIKLCIEFKLENGKLVKPDKLLVENELLLSNHLIISQDGVNHGGLSRIITLKGCAEFNVKKEIENCGEELLQQFFKTHLKYPKEALIKNIEGTVYVNFIIETDGNISKPRLVRDIGGGCGEEAMRLVNLLPKWSNDSLGRISYLLPVEFFLPVEN